MTKPISVSYSRLSTFEQCEQKFDYLYVSKTVQDLGSTATDYGTRVHTALELYGKGLAEGDASAAAIKALEGTNGEAVMWFPLVDKIHAQAGDKYYEFQMAINANKTPCDWFADDVWIRSIADVLIVDGDKATIIDWKSGKVRDNPTQMQLFAAMVMIVFPQVQTVKTSFVWLVYNKVTNTTFTRRMFDGLWMALEPRFVAIQDTVDLGVYKAKPSPLCGWCAAKDICPSKK
jgi:hypothetical protein